MKKVTALLMCFVMVFSVFSVSVSAKFDDSKLTWDGKPITLPELAKILDYDFVDANGDYAPMYSFSAEELWGYGMLNGSDGVFNLDKPVTRVVGTMIILRLIRKDVEAVEANLPCKFTDVPSWAQASIAYAVKEGISAGYSETKFGANDIMTANQCITMVLRALGYKDGTDFVWNKAADKALELGLIGDPCREQYMRSNLFMLDNLAVICSNALNLEKKGTTTALRDTIDLYAVKPTGAMPYSTLAMKNSASAEDKAAKEAEKAAKEELNKILDSLKYYDVMPDVPSYLSVDATATEYVALQEDNLIYYEYNPTEMNLDEYKAILGSLGFGYQGTINIEPTSVVVSQVGNLVTTGTKAYVCNWYNKGDVQVVFGNYKGRTIVRIYSGEVDTFSANGLRAFWRIIAR